MATPIRTLVALDAGLTQDTIAPSLPNDADIELVGIIEGIDDSWRTLQDSPADVLVVCCLGYSERVLFLIESSVRQDPSRPILVLSQGSPNGFVRRVFEVGADDILMLPQPREGVKFAIQKALARKQGGSRRAGTEQSRLVVVLGPKGGTGKTLTASNLAVALAGTGQRVALVDLDLQFGDIGLCMGLSPEKTIHDLVVVGRHARHRQARGLPDRARVGRPDAARAEPARLREHGQRRARFATSTPLLQQRYDFVIVDTPPGFTPEVIASIDLSTDIVMVGMLDSLSLKNTKLGLETLELMGYEPEKIRLVLNRAHSRVGISRRRRGRGARARARGARPERPRDPARGQRRRADRRRPAPVRRRPGFPGLAARLHRRCHDDTAEARQRAAPAKDADCSGGRAEWNSTRDSPRRRRRRPSRAASRSPS